MTVAVVLNYRTPELTVAAVRALDAADPPAPTAIVVDNASGDGSAALIAHALPGVRLLAAPTNGGFSAGCNVGIRAALLLGAARVLLVNPDVVVEPGAIAALERALEEEPQVGVAGPVLVSQTDGETVESLGMRYSTVTGRMRHDGFGLSRSAVKPFTARDVSAVSGCAMLIKREVFEQIGLFSEDYFFGFEDLDFCLRARAAGFRTACVGTATVRHAGQQSIGRGSSRRIYFATRNHLLLAQRMSTGQPRAARWLRQAAVLGFNFAHVLFTSDVRFAPGIAAFSRGVRDYAAGSLGAGSPPGV